MGSRIPPKTSAFVYGFCVFCFSLMIPLLKEEFSKNLIMLSVAGYLGSMVLVFIVITIGHIYEVKGKRQKPGYIAIAIAALISYFLSYCVNFICFAFCFAFSVPMIIYLFHASKMNTPDTIDWNSKKLD